MRRNPDQDADAPVYVIVDHLGLKQRYLRAGADVDLDPFVGREVTVLNDTGLMLDLEQVELRGESTGTQTASSAPVAAERPAPVARSARVSRPRRDATTRSQHFDNQVETAAYEDPPPRFRPGDPTVSAEDTSSGGDLTPETDVDPDAEAADSRVAQRLQRVQQLPLMTSRGQLVVPGQNLAAAAGAAGGGVCPYCGQKHGPSGCACGARGRVFGRVEWLYWWTDGFNIPMLVTTSPPGTPQASAGVLGEPGTTILFGNGEILDGPFDGGRFRAGWWLRGVDKLGIEGDYFGLEQDSVGFSIFANNGSPILARPFFNMLTAAQDSSLVAFPALTEGTATVNAASDLEMAGLRLRIAACCNDIPVFGNATSRVDFLAGYRFSQLDEQLYVFEDSTSLDPMNPGDFNIRDAFVTHNEFHGGEAGVVWEWERPRWSLELIGRIALGTNQQDVFINGNTVVSGGGISLSQTGGILAQRSNIGHYQRNRFSVIPELSATFAFKVTERLRLTAGYTFLYWSQVVRPGDQIDLDLNPNLFPPEAMPFTGPLRPRFVWRESDFWAQGVSAGIDYRW